MVNHRHCEGCGRILEKLKDRTKTDGDINLFYCSICLRFYVDGYASDRKKVIQNMEINLRKLLDSYKGS